MRWLSRVLMGLGLCLGGCGKSAPSTTVLPSNGPRFLALGDSYTIGQSVDEDQRWPMQLARALRDRGIAVAQPQIIAQTGWTTADLSEAMDRANPVGPYALVTLMIGVNNQFQGRAPEEYRGEFATLLARAIALAAGKPAHVLVISTPDWGVTPFAAQQNADANQVAAAIDQFNAIARDQTQKAQAVYIDITPISRQHREMIADDGLHPSGAMYELWVQAMLPAAQQVLK